MPLRDYLTQLGYLKDEVDDICIEYEMIKRILNDPNDLYDIVSWLGWFDEDQEE